MDSSFSNYIEQIIRHRPFCKDVLMRYGELLSVMASETPNINEGVPIRELKSSTLKNGFPLFSRDALPVDLESGKKMLLRFIQGFLNSEKEKNQLNEKAINYLKNNNGILYDILKAVLYVDEEGLVSISDRVNLEPLQLYFLAKTALRPSLNALRAAHVHEIDKTVWDQSYCPFCGSAPDIAYLNGTGKRHLHCELCGEEWPYRRLNCPFCQNEDHTSLGYFCSDPEHGFRVDFCRKCFRYIKTIDRRSFDSETPMELEYLATLHLDIIANEEGFKSMAMGAWARP